MKSKAVINPFVINLFGTGLRYWVLELDKSLLYGFRSKAFKAKVKFEEVFFDLTIINQLGFSHWSEIPHVDDSFGMIIKPSNSIEIRKKYRKIRQLPVTDLIENNLLIQDYNIIESSLDFKPKEDFHYYFLAQFEKGLIAKYKTYQPLRVDQMDFCIKTIPTKSNGVRLLTKIKSELLSINKIKEDTVITSQKVINRESIQQN